MGGPVIAGLLTWGILDKMADVDRLTALGIRVEHLEEHVAKMLEIVLELLQGAGG